MVFLDARIAFPQAKNMFFLIVTFVIGLLGQASSPAAVDIQADLMRGESLYFEARFADAIKVLQPLDAALQTQPERISERVRVKLYLALAQIGSNEPVRAKALFQEILQLDPMFALDAGKFAPKVINFFEETKAEAANNTCVRICAAGAGELRRGNADAALKQIQSAAQCSCDRSVLTDLTDTFYRQGVDSYKENNLQDAMNRFRTVLSLEPKHELAGQYVELIQNKLHIAIEARFLDWRKNFQAGEFGKAAAAYRDLLSVTNDADAKPLDEARKEYRLALDSLGESWRKACVNRDELEMAKIRQRGIEIAAEESMSREFLAQTGSCAAGKKPCIAVDSAVMMSRVRNFTPVSSPLLAPFEGRVVRAQIKVDEYGNTAVEQMSGGNSTVDSFVKSTLEQWKFVPTVVQGEQRCVSFEIKLRL